MKNLKMKDKLLKVLKGRDYVYSSDESVLSDIDSYLMPLVEEYAVNEIYQMLRTLPSLKKKNQYPEAVGYDECLQEVYSIFIKRIHAK